MKCAWRNFIVTMVNAVVDSKCQYERSEIVAHFESQTVLVNEKGAMRKIMKGTDMREKSKED
jgi:hypothetical protein